MKKKKKKKKWNNINWSYISIKMLKYFSNKQSFDVKLLN